MSVRRIKTNGNMLNTGLRTGELLGLLNSDIDLEDRVLHINQAIKELRAEFYFGEDSPLVCDSKGNTNLVNGVKQPDGGVKCLTPRQAGDLLGHSTSQITEMYYVKRDNSRLIGIADNFEI